MPPEVDITVPEGSTLTLKIGDFFESPELFRDVLIANNAVSESNPFFTLDWVYEEPRLSQLNRFKLPQTDALFAITQDIIITQPQSLILMLNSSVPLLKLNVNLFSTQQVRVLNKKTMIQIPIPRLTSMTNDQLMVIKLNPPSSKNAAAILVYLSNVATFLRTAVPLNATVAILNKLVREQRQPLWNQRVNFLFEEFDVDLANKLAWALFTNLPPLDNPLTEDQLRTHAAQLATLSNVAGAADPLTTLSNTLDSAIGLLTADDNSQNLLKFRFMFSMEKALAGTELFDRPAFQEVPRELTQVEQTSVPTVSINVKKYGSGTYIVYQRGVVLGNYMEDDLKEDLYPEFGTLFLSTRDYFTIRHVAQLLWIDSENTLKLQTSVRVGEKLQEVQPSLIPPVLKDRRVLKLSDEQTDYLNPDLANNAYAMQSALRRDQLASLGDLERRSANGGVYACLVLKSEQDTALLFPFPNQIVGNPAEAVKYSVSQQKVKGMTELDRESLLLSFVSSQTIDLVIPAPSNIHVKADWKDQIEVDLRPWIKMPAGYNAVWTRYFQNTRTPMQNDSANVPLRIPAKSGEYLAGLYSVDVFSGNPAVLVQNLTFVVDVTGTCQRCGNGFSVLNNQHGACRWHSRHPTEIFTKTRTKPETIIDLLTKVFGSDRVLNQIQTEIQNHRQELTKFPEFAKFVRATDLNLVRSRVPISWLINMLPIDSGIEMNALQSGIDEMFSILDRNKFTNYSAVGENLWWTRAPLEPLGATFSLAKFIQYCSISDVDNICRKYPECDKAVIYRPLLPAGAPTELFNPNDSSQAQAVLSGAVFINPNKYWGKAKRSMQGLPRASFANNPVQYEPVSTWLCCLLPEDEPGCFIGRHNLHTTLPDLNDWNRDSLNPGSEFIRNPTTSFQAAEAIRLAYERNDLVTAFKLERTFNLVHGGKATLAVFPESVEKVKLYDLMLARGIGFIEQGNLQEILNQVDIQQSFGVWTHDLQRMAEYPSNKVDSDATLKATVVRQKVIEKERLRILQASPFQQEFTAQDFTDIVASMRQTVVVQNDPFWRVVLPNRQPRPGVVVPRLPAIPKAQPKARPKAGPTAEEIRRQQQAQNAIAEAARKAEEARKLREETLRKQEEERKIREEAQRRREERLRQRQLDLDRKNAADRQAEEQARRKAEADAAAAAERNLKRLQDEQDRKKREEERQKQLQQALEKQKREAEEAKRKAEEAARLAKGGKGETADIKFLKETLSFPDADQVEDLRRIYPTDVVNGILVSELKKIFDTLDYLYEREKDVDNRTFSAEELEDFAVYGSFFAPEVGKQQINQPSGIVIPYAKRLRLQILTLKLTKDPTIVSYNDAVLKVFLDSVLRDLKDIDRLIQKAIVTRFRTKVRQGGRPSLHEFQIALRETKEVEPWNTTIDNNFVDSEFLLQLVKRGGNETEQMLETFLASSKLFLQIRIIYTDLRKIRKLELERGLETKDLAKQFYTLYEAANRLTTVYDTKVFAGAIAKLEELETKLSSPQNADELEAYLDTTGRVLATLPLEKIFATSKASSSKSSSESDEEGKAGEEPKKEPEKKTGSDFTKQERERTLLQLYKNSTEATDYLDVTPILDQFFEWWPKLNIADVLKTLYGEIHNLTVDEEDAKGKTDDTYNAAVNALFENQKLLPYIQRSTLAQDFVIGVVDFLTSDLSNEAESTAKALQLVLKVTNLQTQHKELVKQLDERIQNAQAEKQREETARQQRELEEKQRQEAEELKRIQDEQRKEEELRRQEELRRREELERQEKLREEEARRKEELRQKEEQEKREEERRQQEEQQREEEKRRQEEAAKKAQEEGKSSSSEVSETTQAETGSKWVKDITPENVFVFGAAEETQLIRQLKKNIQQRLRPDLKLFFERLKDLHDIELKNAISGDAVLSIFDDLQSRVVQDPRLQNFDQTKTTKLALLLRSFLSTLRQKTQSKNIDPTWNQFQEALEELARVLPKPKSEPEAGPQSKVTEAEVKKAQLDFWTQKGTVEELLAFDEPEKNQLRKQIVDGALLTFTQNTFEDLFRQVSPLHERETKLGSNSIRPSFSVNEFVRQTLAADYKYLDETMSLKLTVAMRFRLNKVTDQTTELELQQYVKKEQEVFNEIVIAIEKLEAAGRPKTPAEIEEERKQQEEAAKRQEEQRRQEQILQEELAKAQKEAEEERRQAQLESEERRRKVEEAKKLREQGGSSTKQTSTSESESTSGLLSESEGSSSEVYGPINEFSPAAKTIWITEITMETIFNFGPRENGQATKQFGSGARTKIFPKIPDLLAALGTLKKTEDTVLNPLPERIPALLDVKPDSIWTPEPYVRSKSASLAFWIRLWLAGLKTRARGRSRPTDVENQVKRFEAAYKALKQFIDDAPKKGSAQVTLPEEPTTLRKKGKKTPEPEQPKVNPPPQTKPTSAEVPLPKKIDLDSLAKKILSFSNNIHTNVLLEKRVETTLESFKKSTYTPVYLTQDEYETAIASEDVPKLTVEVILPRLRREKFTSQSVSDIYSTTLSGNPNELSTFFENLFHKHLSAYPREIGTLDALQMAVVVANAARTLFNTETIINYLVKGQDIYTSKEMLKRALFGSVGGDALFPEFDSIIDSISHFKAARSLFATSIFFRSEVFKWWNSLQPQEWTALHTSIENHWFPGFTTKALHPTDDPLQVELNWTTFDTAVVGPLLLPGSLLLSKLLKLIDSVKTGLFEFGKDIQVFNPAFAAAGGLSGSQYEEIRRQPIMHNMMTPIFERGDNSFRFSDSYNADKTIADWEIKNNTVMLSSRCPARLTGPNFEITGMFDTQLKKAEMKLMFEPDPADSLKYAEAVHQEVKDTMQNFEVKKEVGTLTWLDQIRSNTIDGGEFEKALLVGGDKAKANAANLWSEFLSVFDKSNVDFSDEWNMPIKYWPPLNLSGIIRPFQNQGDLTLDKLAISEDAKDDDYFKFTGAIDRAIGKKKRVPIPEFLADAEAKNPFYRRSWLFTYLSHPLLANYCFGDPAITTEVLKEIMLIVDATNQFNYFIDQTVKEDVPPLRENETWIQREALIHEAIVKTTKSYDLSDVKYGNNARNKFRFKPSLLYLIASPQRNLRPENPLYIDLAYSTELDKTIGFTIWDANGDRNAVLISTGTFTKQGLQIEPNRVANLYYIGTLPEKRSAKVGSALMLHGLSALVRIDQPEALVGQPANRIDLLPVDLAATNAFPPKTLSWRWYYPLSGALVNWYEETGFEPAFPPTVAPTNPIASALCPVDDHGPTWEFMKDRFDTITDGANFKNAEHLHYLETWTDMNGLDFDSQPKDETEKEEKLTELALQGQLTKGEIEEFQYAVGNRLKVGKPDAKFSDTIFDNTIPVVSRRTERGTNKAVPYVQKGEMWQVEKPKSPALYVIMSRFRFSLSLEKLNARVQESLAPPQQIESRTQEPSSEGYDSFDWESLEP